MAELSHDSPSAVEASPATSERKVAANRANAQKSTGPRSRAGKNHSRLNAVKHGILSSHLPRSQDGKLLDPELDELREHLLDFYGRDDVRVLILVDGVVLEYWRQLRALRSEKLFNDRADKLQPHPSEFVHYPNQIQILQRYARASQNALLRQLKMLDCYLQRPERPAGTTMEKKLVTPVPLNGSQLPKAPGVEGVFPVLKRSRR